MRGFVYLVYMLGSLCIFAKLQNTDWPVWWLAVVIFGICATEFLIEMFAYYDRESLYEIADEYEYEIKGNLHKGKIREGIIASTSKRLFFDRPTSLSYMKHLL